MRTGLLIGLVLARLTVPRMRWTFGHAALAATVALALAGSSALASTLAPAAAPAAVESGQRSGLRQQTAGRRPQAASEQDVPTLVVHFGRVTVIVL